MKVIAILLIILGARGLLHGFMMILIAFIDEAEYMGAGGIAFLAGKWETETKDEAYGDQHPRFGFPESANDTVQLADFFAKKTREI